MEYSDNAIRLPENASKLRRMKEALRSVIALAGICVAWAIAAYFINQQTVLPSFASTMREFFAAWVNARVISNLLLTLQRVLLGCFYAVILGTVIGLIMGYSEKCMTVLSPIVNSVRQVPIMAWVPLSIVWFGLGEGPTVFLIFMSALFPLILNIIAGVSGIDKNYINAARSMGANTPAIFRDVIIPGTLPSFLTGLRLAVGAGWMSVICAEFIATSSGFGFLMIEAQERIQTPKLYALMIISAIVGFLMDQVIRFAERKLTGWRYKNAAAKN